MSGGMVLDLDKGYETPGWRPGFCRRESSRLGKLSVCGGRYKTPLRADGDPVRLYNCSSLDLYSSSVC
jgi:hypothetical protein